MWAVHSKNVLWTEAVNNNSLNGDGKEAARQIGNDLKDVQWVSIQELCETTECDGIF